MAAITHVVTIARVAQILGCDEALIWDISDNLEPGYGMLWVDDVGERAMLAFTEGGIEALRELINERAKTA